MRSVRTKIPPFDLAYEIVLTDVKCITKQQNSSDLWPFKVKRDCIVDKSLKNFKLIKNAVRSILGFQPYTSGFDSFFSSF